MRRTGSALTISILSVPIGLIAVPRLALAKAAVESGSEAEIAELEAEIQAFEQAHSSAPHNLARGHRAPASESSKESGKASKEHHVALGPLTEQQRQIRLKHAHELLGRYYKRSSVTVGESIPKINSTIYRWTKDHLPAKYKDQSGKIAQTIIDQSLKQKFDPVFLLSVIEGESSWRPEKIGGVGEIGLMQLRPSTARWMASRAGVKWQGKKTLLDPCQNIKIGAAYLSYLRDRFDDHARLYLAAYNMGQANVDSAMDKKIWPKDYPIHIMKRYVEFYETIGATIGAKTAPTNAPKAAAEATTALSEPSSKTRAPRDRS